MVELKKKRKSKPKFPRLGARKKRINEKTWRKPKGMHGRVKKLLSYHKGASPDIGYGSPKNLRNKHTTGLEIVDVSNLSDLKKINPKMQMIKISNVGKKKKIAIVEESIKKGIKISNLRKPKEYISKNKKEVKK